MVKFRVTLAVKLRVKLAALRLEDRVKVPARAPPVDGRVEPVMPPTETETGVAQSLTLTETGVAQSLTLTETGVAQAEVTERAERWTVEQQEEGEGAAPGRQRRVAVNAKVGNQQPMVSHVGR